MTRLLVCAQSYPYPADQGGRIRYAHFLETLRGAYDVTLVLVRRANDAARRPAPDATDLVFSDVRVVRNALRSLVSGVPLQFGAIVDRTSGTEVARLARAADAFIAFEPRAGLHHRFLPREMPRLIDLPDSPVIAARAQWSGDRGIAQRARGLENLAKVGRLERELVTAFDVICAAGPADVRRIEERFPGARTRLVPTAIALPAHTAPIAAARDVLFTGDLSFAPNADAARFLVSEVWPRVRSGAPDARLMIVGHPPDEGLRKFLSASRVETAYSVPDMAPFLDRARVVLAPMRIGSGVKVKVLTAMAAGRPVVMTPLANEGIDATTERDALIASDAPSLADAVVRVLREDDTAERIGIAGRALVSGRFSPRAVGATFLAAVGEALSARGSRRG